MLQVWLTFGMLLGYSIGPYVPFRIFAAICSVWIVLYLIISYWMPESPYRLLAKGKPNIALQKLMKLRRLKKGDEELEEEFLLMEETVLADLAVQQGSFKDIFKVKNNRRAFVILLVLLSTLQFSGEVLWVAIDVLWVIVLLLGVPTVMVYSSRIFALKGIRMDPSICSIIIGLVQFLASCVVPFVIDKFGRKILLGVGCGGMAASQVGGEILEEQN